VSAVVADVGWVFLVGFPKSAVCGEDEGRFGVGVGWQSAKKRPRKGYVRMGYIKNEAALLLRESRGHQSLGVLLLLCLVWGGCVRFESS
jgi:hypothetical protein